MCHYAFYKVTALSLMRLIIYSQCQNKHMLGGIGDLTPIKFGPSVFNKLVHVTNTCGLTFKDLIGVSGASRSLDTPPILHKLELLKMNIEYIETYLQHEKGDLGPYFIHVNLYILIRSLLWLLYRLSIILIVCTMRPY